jgi:hypothetical protein
VSVKNVRPESADQCQESDGHGRVDQGRDFALQLRDVEGSDAELVRDVLHRPLRAADLPSSEERLVADLVQTAAEIGDVKCGPTDVQARDHSQNANWPVVLTHVAMLPALAGSTSGRLTNPEQSRLRLPRGAEGKRTETLDWVSPYAGGCIEHD